MLENEVDANRFFIIIYMLSYMSSGGNFLIENLGMLFQGDGNFYVVLFIK